MCKSIFPILVIGIALLSFEGNAQNFQLSIPNLNKLNKIENGRERILRYQKYFRRDSLKYERALRRAFRQRVDSAWRANKTRVSRREIALPGIPKFQDKIKRNVIAVLDSAGTISPRDGLPGDSVRFDSAAMQMEIFKRINKGQDFNLPDGIPLKGTTLPDAGDLMPGGNQKTGFDQLPDVNEPSAIFDGLQKTNPLPGVQDDINEFSRKPAEISDKVQALENEDGIDQVKLLATQKLGQMAPAKVISAQRHVAKLLSKYREFVNSEDPESALKRTSLKGRTFGERVFAGINLNPVSVVPVSFDIAPQLGYKFNRKFFTGISFRYRVGLKDSIDRRTHLSSANLAYSVFSSFTLRKSLFAYAESETVRTTPGENDRVGGSWRMNYFAGVGRRFLIHPKLYFNVLVLYNFAGGNSNPVHPDRFQCRIGVSMSELAIRKKLIHYNPNR